jgi:hypothetical protein
VTLLARAAAAASLVAALWFGWRWAALGHAVAERQRTLAAALAAGAGGATDDPSSRVAIAVHRNERLFDEMLALATARRLAGWLALGAAGASLGLGALAYRGRRRVAAREGR